MDKLVNIAMGVLSAKDGSLYLKTNPDKSYLNLADALTDHFISTTGGVPGDVYALFNDKAQVKEFEKLFRNKVRAENARLRNYSQGVVDHPLKTVLDYVVIITDTEGRPPEVWVRSESGGYIACGGYTDEKLMDNMFFALKYKSPPNVREKIVGVYNAMLEKMEFEAASSNTKPKAPPPFYDWLIKFLKIYRAEIPPHDIEITPLSWDSRKTPAIKRLDRKLFNNSRKNGTLCPNWDEFTSRLSHPNEFKSWVWSLFSGDLDTRQILWIQGRGNDGKSTVTRALRRMVGPDITSSINLRDSNQFTAYQFLNKRFAIESDARSGEIIDHPLIFKLSGCDAITFEGKNKSAFTGVVSTHVMVCANIPPKIDTYSDAQMSRLLFIKVRPIKSDPKSAREFADDSFEDKLVEEMYSFLAECATTHAQIATKDNRIPIPSDMVRMITTECKSLRVAAIEKYIVDNYELALLDDTGIDEVEFRNELFRYLKKSFLSNSALAYNTTINYLVYGLGCRIDEGKIYGLLEKRD